MECWTCYVRVGWAKRRGVSRLGREAVCNLILDEIPAPVIGRFRLGRAMATVERLRRK